MKIIGIDSENKDIKKSKITDIGKKASSFGNKTLIKLLEKIYSQIIIKIVRRLETEQLIPEKTTLVLSTRADTPAYCKNRVKENIKKTGIEKKIKDVVILENLIPFGFTYKVLQN